MNKSTYGDDGKGDVSEGGRGMQECMRRGGVAAGCVDD